MDYSVIAQSVTEIETDCLILGFYAKRKLLPEAARVDDHLQGLLTQLLKRDGIEGKPGNLLVVNHVPGFGSQRIVLVGLGKKNELNPASYRKALAAAASKAMDCGAKQAVSLLHEAVVSGHDSAWGIRQAVELFEAAAYRFTGLKKDEDEKPHRLTRIHFSVLNDDTAVLEGAIKLGKSIALGMNIARDLANLPGNICTPTYLADQAEHLVRHKKLKCRILNESDLEALGMNAFLSVSKGSEQPAKLIILEYSGGDKNDKPYVLIGKGLTFDAGGISIKPAANMDEMKYDMCGGAAVIGTLAAVSELELPINVVGLVPASENLPDGKANKPGDIIKTMLGLTVEILNTDAEGRLLLCDVLTYAQRYEPEVVIDVATLTGACIVALGRHPSGLMSNNEKLAADLTQAANTAWDRVWSLPLWDDYQEQLKSNFADLANIGGPDGGSITAGCFLSRFAKDLTWAHIDIAGTAWKTGKDKGATGRPVPLLVQYLCDRSKPE
ncbi:MAG: leucyl aminopeptidase [Methylococcaceae bacterium]